MFDCLFIGSSTKDLLMQVATPPSSDQRITATRKVTACGGPGSTAAVAFSSLGGNAALITPIGDDDSAEFIRADLCARNFSHLDLINIPNAESSFSVIQVEPDGKRCITCYGGCTENLTLIINASEGQRKISASDIRYVEVMGHNVTYHTTQGNIFVGYDSLRSIRAKLEPYDFALCDRSFLVNLKYVTGVSKENLYLGKEVLKIAKSRRAEFMLALTKYFSDEV